MKKMISLYHNTNNPYALYGVKHFIQKYGIPIEINNKEKSKIGIAYGTKNKGDFTIQIPDNGIKEDICGLANRDSNSRVLVTSAGGNKEYPYVIIYNDNKIYIGLDIFKEIGCILSGHMESVFEDTDKEIKRKLLRLPIIDIYERILFNSLLLASQKLKLPLVQKAFWPEGKKFAVCLTHDVDEITKKYQYITRTLRCLKKRDFGGIKNQMMSLIEKIKGNEPYWTFDNVREVENELGVKSTFFFLNEKGKVNPLDTSTWKHYARIRNINDPKLVKEIRKLYSEGWDIGLHGSFYSYLDFKKLKEEKEELEKILGAKVCGNRQHNLNISIPKTWRYHEEIGLDYDSTLGFNDCMGFRWGTCFPFHPFDPDKKRAISLLEIPLAIEDVTFLSYNGATWSDCFDIVNAVEKYNGVLTLLWHHAVFNNYEYPGFSERYKELVEFCKEKNAWVTNANEISKWWRMRKESKLEYTYDKNILSIEPDTKNYFIKIYLPGETSAEIITENAEIVCKVKDSIVLKTIKTKDVKDIEIMLK